MQIFFNKKHMVIVSEQAEASRLKVIDPAIKAAIIFKKTCE